MAQNKYLVADAQTLLEENLSEKKSVESARRLRIDCSSSFCSEETAEKLRISLKFWITRYL